MIARLTSISIHPKDVDQVRKIYYDQLVPVIKKQRGNVGVWLLEPTNEKDDFISLTEWISKADAEAYESSGTYKELVGKVKHLFRGEAVLRTYSTAEAKIMATV